MGNFSCSFPEDETNDALLDLQLAKKHCLLLFVRRETIWVFFCGLTIFLVLPALHVIMKLSYFPLFFDSQAVVFVMLIFCDIV